MWWSAGIIIRHFDVCYINNQRLTRRLINEVNINKIKFPGKFVLTIFFGHIFAIGLVVSGLIMAVKMSKAIDSNPYGGTNTIIESFQNTINDSQYRHHWIRIHQDFRCCGIEGLEKYLNLVEDNITFVKYHQIWSKRFTTVFKSPESEPSMTENKKKQLEKLLVVAKKMGVNIDLCPNILRDAHRGCGLLLLSRLDKKTNLLKFYGTLILPMIFIADMLFFLGYLCFKEIKITLMSEVVPK